jgi:hypothetical protein
MVLLLMLFFVVILPYIVGPAAAPSGGQGNQLQSPGSSSGAGGATPTAPIAGYVPPISERFFDSGTSHVAVTGALTQSGDLAIDTITSYVSPQGRALIVFGPPDPEALIVVFTVNEPEDALTVTQGVLRATGIEADCTFNVQVTDELISGHISCPAVDAFDGDVKVGTASIELDITAESAPEGG